MHVTDPYGRPYAYDGEEIIVETPLTAEQHAGCYEAVGITAPTYEPDQQYVSIEPPDGNYAERLRRYLREQRIEHQSELTVTYKPDSPPARELIELFELLRSAPVLPGALALAARAPHTDSDVEVVEALHGSVGADQARAHIEDAQRLEADVRELIALADRLELDEYALDEAVHDSQSGDASQINNEGHEAQIRHLVATNNIVVARQLIEQAR
jgi:hypothetical protein